MISFLLFFALKNILVLLANLIQVSYAVLRQLLSSLSNPGTPIQTGAWLQSELTGAVRQQRKNGNKCLRLNKEICVFRVTGLKILGRVHVGTAFFSHFFIHLKMHKILCFPEKLKKYPKFH